MHQKCQQSYSHHLQSIAKMCSNNTKLVINGSPLRDVPSGYLRWLVVALSKEQHLGQRPMAPLSTARFKGSRSKEPAGLRHIICNQLQRCASNTQLFEAPTPPPRAYSGSIFQHKGKNKCIKNASRATHIICNQLQRCAAIIRRT